MEEAGGCSDAVTIQKAAAAVVAGIQKQQYDVHLAETERIRHEERKLKRAHAEKVRRAALKNSSAKVTPRRANSVLNGAVEQYVQELERTLDYARCKECGGWFSKVDFSKANVEICRLCDADLAKYGLSRFGVDNGFDIREMPPELKILNAMERRCIAKCSLVMRIFVTPFCTQKMSRGHALLCKNDVDQVLEKLPRSPANVEYIVVRKPGDRQMCPEERIRTNAVVQALLWLKKHNKLYYDIVIDQEQGLHGDDVPEAAIILAENTRVSEPRAQGDTPDSGLTLDQEPSDCTFIFAGDVESSVTSTTVGYLQQEFLHANSTPLSEYDEEDYLPAAFPWLFPYGTGGRKEDRKIPVSDGEYFSRIIRRSFFCEDIEFLFYATNFIRRKGVSGVSYAMEKNGHLPAVEEILEAVKSRRTGARSGNAGLTDAMTDASEEILQRISPFARNLKDTPAFWAAAKRTLFAMIGNPILGETTVPSVFATFSSGDLHWPELYALHLQKSNGGLSRERTLEIARTLSERERLEILALNPVICAEMFQKRWELFFHRLLQQTELLGKFEDYFVKYECQYRGSLHVHLLLWSKLQVQSGVYVDTHRSLESGDVEKVQEAWDLYCSAANPPAKTGSTRIDALLSDIVERCQTHRHTPSCLKRSQQQKKQLRRDECRYRFPRPLSDRTQIIYDPSAAHGDDRLKVVVKRSDPMVNPYNPHASAAWGANTDLQFISSPYGPAQYCANYTSKAEASFQEIAKEVVGKLLRSKQLGLKPREWVTRLANGMIGCQTMPAQKAALILLRVRLFDISRCEERISVPLPSREASRLLTRDASGQMSLRLPSQRLFDLYANRPVDLEDLSLVDFTATYTLSRSTSVARRQDAQPFLTLRRRKAVVLAFPVLKPSTDSSDFAFSVLFRYRPWRNFEEEISSQNVITLLEAHRRSLPQEVQYLLGVEAVLDRDTSQNASAWSEPLIADETRISIPAVRDDNEEITEQMDPRAHPDSSCSDEDTDFNTGLFEEARVCSSVSAAPLAPVTVISPQTYRQASAWIEDQIAIRKTSTTTDRGRTDEGFPIETFTEEDPELDFRMQANEDQRRAMTIVLSEVIPDEMQQQGRQPLRLVVLGEAGTGKSFLIHHMRKIINRRLGFNKRGEQIGPVLVCAPTGTAAANVDGETVHRALHLSTSRSKSFEAPTTHVRRKLERELSLTRLIIIDEFSMISPEVFAQISERLCYAFSSSEPFGGVHVVLVGDIRQLPPVTSLPVFDPLCTSKTSTAVGHALYLSYTKAVVLKQQMRQHEDDPLSGICRRARTGNITAMDIEALNARVQQQPDEDSTCIVATNSQRITINNKVLERQVSETGRGYCLWAWHGFSEAGKHAVGSEQSIRSNASPSKKRFGDRDVLRQSWHVNSSSSKIPSCFLGTVGSPVALTRNIAVSMSLTNGRHGTLIGLLIPNTAPPFENRTDPDLRACAEHMPIPLVQIPEFRGESFLPDIQKVVPIPPVECAIHVRGQTIRRRGYPMELASAKTVHKSQGATYVRTHVNFNSMTTYGQSYVALSRCRSLAGLTLQHPVSQGTFNRRSRLAEVVDAEERRLLLLGYR